MSENAGKNWYDEGMDDADEQARKKTNYIPWRWKMPKNTSGKTTLVTDVPFSYYQHELKLNGKFGNFFTCRRRQCALCEAGNEPTKVYAWVCVDHRTYTDKKGNQHTDTVKLFILKPKMALRMKKLREKNEGLRGLRLEIERTGGGFSYATGDTIDADEKFSEEKIKGLKWWPKQKLEEGTNKPVGYDWGNITKEQWIEIFAPKEAGELKRLVRTMADESIDEKTERREDDDGGDDKDSGDGENITW